LRQEIGRLLGPCPIDHLPVSGEPQRSLSLCGLERLGQHAALHPAALEARLSPEGRRAWELSRGRDDSALVPRRPFRPIAESLEFPAPVSEWETQGFRDR